ncbi:hypothetical protein BP6252_12425 [Coleophoma cylindrospora]|uniref:2EXR domain-containing protein n=1 Tax=Coleophoma cylindrospora TaxID=1849047 RepID=A0A3D8QGU3_9HELO|nr:hypothetical protein BP6252_12425 [Coleophoma cylindrospora]
MTPTLDYTQSPDLRTMEDTKSNSRSSISDEPTSNPAPTSLLRRDVELMESQDMLTFIQFAKLPAEIRCMIWRATFADQQRIYDLDNNFNVRVSNTVSKPVTLYVNQESRNETLKHYYLLYPHADTCCSPIYINPSIDIFTVSCFYLEKNNRVREDLMKTMVSRNPDIFRKVTFISFLDAVFRGGDVRSYFPTDWVSDRAWFFEYFTNLQEVQLNVSLHGVSLTAVKLQTGLEEFYALRKLTNSETTVPRVIMVPTELKSYTWYYDQRTPY